MDIDTEYAYSVSTYQVLTGVSRRVAASRRLAGRAGAPGGSCPPGAPRVSGLSSGGLRRGVERLDDRAEVGPVHRVLLAAVAERVERDLGAGAAVEVTEPRPARRSPGHVAGEAVV